MTHLWCAYEGEYSDRALIYLSFSQFTWRILAFSAFTVVTNYLRNYLHVLGLLQGVKYTAHGHKLRFFWRWKAQFVTVGIIYRSFACDSEQSDTCATCQCSKNLYERLRDPSLHLHCNKRSAAQCRSGWHKKRRWAKVLIYKKIGKDKPVLPDLDVIKDSLWISNQWEDAFCTGNTDRPIGNHWAGDFDPGIWSYFVI